MRAGTDGRKSLSLGLAVLGALASAQAAEAVTTLKTGMVQINYAGDALQCAVTNVSGHR